LEKQETVTSSNGLFTMWNTAGSTKKKPNQATRVRATKTTSAPKKKKAKKEEFDSLLGFAKFSK